jgi:hypothetical protein
MGEQTRFTFRVAPDATTALAIASPAELEGGQLTVRWGDGESVALIERAEADGDGLLVTMVIS